MPKSDTAEFADVAETVSSLGLLPGMQLQCPMGVKVEVEGVGRKDKVLYMRYPSDIVTPTSITDLDSLVCAGYKIETSFLRDLIHLVDVDVLKGLAGQEAETISRKSRQTEIEPNLREHIMHLPDRCVFENFSLLSSSAVRQVRERMLLEKKTKTTSSRPLLPIQHSPTPAVDPARLLSSYSKSLGSPSTDFERKIKKYFERHYNDADLPENVKLHFSQFPVPSTPETKTTKSGKKKKGTNKSNKAK
uniref:Uncharacterized protein n=1 Tax=Guillardia theta TaxID=55529 RepID=A0A6U6DPM8_GUITH|mmetsp:Transcript_6722/g.23659  ORF Transcript_6722/g.23659 Transcript_6722/m.23659 type:complete len:247 (+) Transcript_6722:237-977(+)